MFFIFLTCILNVLLIRCYLLFDLKTHLSYINLKYKKKKKKINHLLDNIVIDLSNHFWNFVSMINIRGKEKTLNLLKFISSKINLNSLMLVKVIYHV